MKKAEYDHEACEWRICEPLTPDNLRDDWSKLPALEEASIHVTVKEHGVHVQATHWNHKWVRPAGVASASTKDGRHVEVWSFAHYTSTEEDTFRTTPAFSIVLISNQHYIANSYTDNGAKYETAMWLPFEEFYKEGGEQ